MGQKPCRQKGPADMSGSDCTKASTSTVESTSSTQSVIEGSEETSYFNAAAPKFSMEGKKTYALCVDVYDGDTVKLIFAINEGGPQFKWSVRLKGINTAEIRGTSGAEKTLAVAARDRLRDLVLAKVIVVDVGGFDKYGRVLGTLFLKNGKNINELLVSEGLAEPYMV